MRMLIITTHKTNHFISQSIRERFGSIMGTRQTKTMIKIKSEQYKSLIFRQSNPLQLSQKNEASIAYGDNINFLGKTKRKKIN